MGVAFRGATAICSFAGVSGAQSVSFSVGTQPFGGDLVVAGGTVASLAGALTSIAVTDDKGNGTYSSDESQAVDGTDDTRAFIHHKENITNGGTLQLTFTLGASTQEYFSCGGVAFSGVVVASALDVHTSLQTLNTNTTTIGTGTTGTSTVADAVAVTAMGTHAGVNVSSLSVSGYTMVVSEVDGVAKAVGGLAYKILNAAATQTATWTLGATSGSAADDHAGSIAVFKGRGDPLMGQSHQMYAMGMGTF